MAPNKGSAPLSERTSDLVAALFPGESREVAARLLELHCGTNLPFLEALDPVRLERYRFAALRISQGDLRRLERAIDLARIDWRDLLMEADFGHDTSAHERWCADTLRAAGHAP